MKYFALIALTQAVKLEYDTAGGLLTEPEFMRVHPEWKSDSLLSTSNEFQRQRPDIYLGTHADVRRYGDFVGGHSEFELGNLLSEENEHQK